jgi:hypothetical protein
MGILNVNMYMISELNVKCIFIDGDPVLQGILTEI